MTTPEHNVQYLDLPTTIHSFVRSNPDTSYTIVINARLSNDGRLKAYDHEIHHIQNGDYDYDITRDLNQIELEAHEAAVSSLPEPEQAPDPQPARKRRKRRKTSTWRKRRNVMRTLGISVDPWAEHERHWLDPEWRKY